MEPCCEDCNFLLIREIQDVEGVTNRAPRACQANREVLGP
jgi:hypothetical protein